MTDRQESSSSMAPLAVNHVKDEDTSEIDKPAKTLRPITVIPVREEFRCRRTWFFHHDIRAFVTSWIPTELSQVFPSVKFFRYIPIFIFWRLFMSIYTIVWLFLHIAARNNGVRWLIYLTDLAYLVLTTAMLLMTILNIWYLILYYGFPDKINQYIPAEETPLTEVYRQDNIPWFAKICWFVYVLGTSLAPMIVVGYWGVVFDANPEVMPSITNTTNGSGIENTTQFGPPVTGGLVPGPSDIDVYTIQFHAINVVLVLLDMFFTRMPFQFLHFFYAMIFFQIPWVIFSIIYWAAGGTNPDDEMRYIYSPLEYSMASAFGFAFLLIVGALPSQIVLFLIAWLRDVIYTHIRCCFRDVRRMPFREESVTFNQSKEAESTTV